MTAASVITRWRTRLRSLRRSYAVVQDEATADTLRRFLVMLRVVVPLHLALAWWFGHYTAPPGQAHLAQWAYTLMWMQASTLAGLVFFSAGIWALRAGAASRPAAARLLQWGIGLMYLVYGAMVSVVETVVGGDISTFVLVCLGAASLSLLRPTLSALSYGVAIAAFGWGIHATPLDPTLRASLMVRAVSTALMAQLVATLMWHQYVAKVLLQRQLRRANRTLLDQQQTLLALAERDTLTGLYNRRKLMQTATQSLARATRAPQDICLLLIDLDHFKHVNDLYGHPTGDAMLQHTAQVLASQLRSTDTLARWGGEEFIVLMPYTQPEGAMALAQKLREALRSKPLAHDGQVLAITASVGVTALAAHRLASFDALYAAADAALYQAKVQGRDRAVFCAVAAAAPPPDYAQQRART